MSRDGGGLLPAGLEGPVVIAAGRSLCVGALLLATLLVVPVPSGRLPSADAAVVAQSHCRQWDPNLVRGACLRYHSRSGTAYTWIGTYRASNGRVFFCIDYLYDPRIAGRPTLVSTEGLVNQLGKRIGDAEVAALNYVVSTWAGNGSTGSNTRDAAIALIIRELMSDGVRPDGTVVYPRGLTVGGTVRPPIGGLRGAIMDQAQRMWSEASRYRGGYRLLLTSASSGAIKLGTSRRYRLAVMSAAGYQVPGVRVRFSCVGPIVCPGPVSTGPRSTPVEITPREVGDFVVTAEASAPATDGRIYRVGGWHSHGGATAKNRGIQRGWIAERRPMRAVVRARADIVKGTPTVVTTASHQVASIGTPLYDRVAITGLPSGYRQRVTATLFGPFAHQPGVESCTAQAEAESVSFEVDRNGEFTSPEVIVQRPGYYVWVESLPGDERTHPVTTACGIAEETTQVLARTPEVATRISAQRAVVGRSVHDTVAVRGLAATDRVRVRWTLHGPLAPRRGSCAGLDWSTAGVLDRGEFVAVGNGTYRTRPSVLKVPGCVTYSEAILATGTTAAATSAPGQRVETALVTRPVTPFVPEIPSGPAFPGIRRARS